MNASFSDSNTHSKRRTQLTSDGHNHQSQKSPCDENNSEACDGSHLHDVHDFSEKQINARLLEASQLCTQKGVRFTPLRQTVYKLILQADKPLGAYDLIQSLQDNRIQQQGKNAKMVAPPTIYRTLEFLLELGFIHQLTSMNAFVPCCHPRDEHNAVFLLCDNCQRVQEFSGLPVQEIVGYVKQQVGFRVQQSVMELKGICNTCLSASPSLSVQA